MEPTVSIVIPTRNGGIQFQELLVRLGSQKSVFKPELIVVDSGSSDETVSSARRSGAKVIEIDPATFSHGETRNLGIGQSQGELCILLVQDALPIDDNWLYAMVKHFAEDLLICGVTTRQVPRPDADAVARWEVVAHNEHLGIEKKIRSISDWHEFEKLSLEDRFFVCNFDNVCSAVRRSVWEKIPFRPVSFAEDLDWGIRALEHGYKIVYEPQAGVIHSHLRPALYHLRRQYVSAKIVPEILRCPTTRIFAKSEEDLFRAVNVLLDEALLLLIMVDEFDGNMSVVGCQSMLRQIEAVGLCASDQSLNGELSSGDRTNPIRAHFFFLLSLVTRTLVDLDKQVFRHLVVHCAARSIGGFLGAYYLWSEKNGGVSAALQRLDDCLRGGV
jgi:rhamnosyltransferase